MLMMMRLHVNLCASKSASVLGYSLLARLLLYDVPLLEQ